LLVEDEGDLLTAVSDRLRKEGYVVDSASHGETGFEKATSVPFDLIILDIVLPGRNGIDLCRVGTPVLMLTGRTETVDKIVGIKLGADAYVTKPFDMLELIARVEALLRRMPARAGEGTDEFGSIRVDKRAMEVTREGIPVYLSVREFRLLCYFAENRGITLSREQILRDVWGYDVSSFTRTVDMHVASLRQKVEKDPKSPRLILTVHGLGYKFAG
jgi:two-component system alkaline phosphatase synthesis response regulator PhoP